MIEKRDKFAARVFLAAGIYGVAVLLPQYFLEEKLGRDFPPPVNHPEHFYGFVGVALAWQFVFLLIARDVQRYRLFMLPAILEKLSFGVAAVVLYAQSRVTALVAGAGIIDLLLAVLFALSFCASRRLPRRSWDRRQRQPPLAVRNERGEGHQTTDAQTSHKQNEPPLPSPLLHREEGETFGYSSVVQATVLSV